MALLHRNGLVALLLALMALSSFVEAINWMSKSSDLATPAWRRYIDLNPQIHAHPKTSASGNTPFECLGHETAGEDKHGPLKFGPCLFITKRLGELNESSIKSRVSFGHVKSLPELRLEWLETASPIVASDVDLALFKNIIDQVLAESTLEELEILHPSFDFDLSRQASIKRVAIASSMIDALPSHPNLEELALSGLEETAPVISRFSQVSSITLSGAYDTIRDVDLSMNKRSKIRFVVTLPAQRKMSSRSDLSDFSSLGSILDLSINASWTNATLNATVCDNDPSLVSTLTMTCPSTGTGAAWFRLPSCVAEWTSLDSITVSNCQMPVLNALPASLIYIDLRQGYGTWTKAEAGTDTTGGAFSGYFDWSWLTRQPSLQFIRMNNIDVTGTLPNDISHPNLTELRIYGPGTEETKNRLVGTVSPRWFLQYPSLTDMTVIYHDLTGTFPNYGLEKVQTLQFDFCNFTHWPPLVINATAGFGPPSQLSITSFFDNELVEIPSQSDFQSMPKLSSFAFTMNPISGPFPNIFKSMPPRDSSSVPLSSIVAASCKLTGSLPEIPSNMVELYNTVWLTSPTLILNDNDLSGTIPSSWANMSFRFLNIDTNPGLSGTLATVDSKGFVISQFAKDAESLSITGSGFNGPMFNISTMTSLKNLFLELPNVDFCAANRAGLANFTAPNLPACTIIGNATMCPDAYPAACLLQPTPVFIPSGPPPVSPSIPTPSGSSNTIATGLRTTFTIASALALFML